MKIYGYKFLERHKVSGLSLPLTKLQKHKPIKPKARRRKKIIKREINEIENTKSQSISETKSWIFEKIKLLNFQIDQEKNYQEQEK